MSLTHCALIRVRDVRAVRADAAMRGLRRGCEQGETVYECDGVQAGGRSINANCSEPDEWGRCL
jgi:hypothetical protein